MKSHIAESAWGIPLEGFLVESFLVESFPVESLLV
jgi:hypothetical protein